MEVNREGDEIDGRLTGGLDCDIMEMKRGEK